MTKPNFGQFLVLKQIVHNQTIRDKDSTVDKATYNSNKLFLHAYAKGKLFN